MSMEWIYLGQKRVGIILRKRVSLLALFLVSFAIMMVHNSLIPDIVTLSHFWRGVNQPRVSRQIYDRKGKVIFVFSNQRSGSTFLGDFFNKNPSIFYLYEPLVPYDFYCEKNIEARMKTLERMSICDFKSVVETYQISATIDGMTAGDRARCRRDNICYDYKSEVISNKYSSLCDKIHRGELSLQLNENVKFDLDTLENRPSSSKAFQTCAKPTPYNFTIVSGLCAASSAVVYKILRVSDLSMLEQLYDVLQKKNNDVYIIQLVRDPRAIIRSHDESENVKPEDLKAQTEKVCQRMKRNVQYVENRETDQQGMVFRRHFLRVRFEDIAKDPMKAAKEIYEFVGLSLPSSLMDWLKQSTTDPQVTIKLYEQQLASASISAKERQEITTKIKLLKKATGLWGTVRDSKKVRSAWRKSISMQMVNNVQKSCEFAMNRLGYKLVPDEATLRDLTLDLTEDL